MMPNGRWFHGPHMAGPAWSGQKVECPVLVLWGTQAFVGRGYEPLRVWQQYATDVRGTALPTGHFLPEEAPSLVSDALRGFLR